MIPCEIPNPVQSNQSIQSNPIQSRPHLTALVKEEKEKREKENKCPGWTLKSKVGFVAYAKETGGGHQKQQNAISISIAARM
jgi:hypothetical protein